MAERGPPSRGRRKAAAALKYRPARDAAPRLVAKGQGLIAQRIVDLARESGVPVHDDPDLVEVLAQLDVGELIPVELYQVVAEVLVYVYRMNAMAGRAAVRPRPHSADSGGRLR